MFLIWFYTKAKARSPNKKKAKSSTTPTVTAPTMWPTASTSTAGAEYETPGEGADEGLWEKECSGVWVGSVTGTSTTGTEADSGTVKDAGFFEGVGGIKGFTWWVNSILVDTALPFLLVVVTVYSAEI